VEEEDGGRNDKRMKKWIGDAHAGEKPLYCSSSGRGTIKERD